MVTSLFFFSFSNPPPQAHHTDYNADELLKTLAERPGVKSYLVYNQDGELISF